MANYSYRCKDCNEVSDVKHSMSENPEIECKACGSKNTYRIISGGSGVIFKPNSSGLRTSSRGSNWDWASSRPNPSQGHKLTAEERRHIEQKTVSKYEKQIENEMNKQPTVTKAVTNILKHDAKKLNK
jgi:putative FmdB family regulatory protein